MVSVSYSLELPYVYDTEGRRQPGFREINVWSPSTPDCQIAIDAYLDSGAERSLFDGRVAPELNIDLLSGPELSYTSTLGQRMFARLHRVRLFHPHFDEIEMEVGFSTDRIRRSILGRDFFVFSQIGFEERRETVLLSRL